MPSIFCIIDNSLCLSLVSKARDMPSPRIWIISLYGVLWCIFVNSIKNKRHNYTLLHTLLTYRALTHYAIPRAGTAVTRSSSRRRSRCLPSLVNSQSDCFRRETVCGPIAHLLSFPKKLTLVKFLFGLVARHLGSGERAQRGRIRVKVRGRSRFWMCELLPLVVGRCP